MQRVDVAIVGGGPAGSSAAKAAAANGADAVVLEKGVPRADRQDLGPDSTDAAGILDYWVDIMGIHPDEMPDGVVLRELDSAEFIGPNESLTLESTGIDSSYDHFGFTMHRARFDDFLRDEAEAAGADYRVGTSVRRVETDLDGGHIHHLFLQDGSDMEAEYLVLADGPQRRVTLGVLDQFLPDDTPAADWLSPATANHIAYQEHREFPDELLDPASIKFWWGWMPGETAYPWVFPNDDNVGRVGLTMPIGLDLDAVPNREDYRLLDAGDDGVPPGRVYLRRLLEELYGDEYDVDEDFPLVDDRGKQGGTETYAISSTRPIDSPTKAGVAVVGGAMGATSAFHEGGDHVAVRTGRLAGELAATDDLRRYNDAWKDAIGSEVRRNVAMADIVSDYGPADWDRAISVSRDIIAHREEGGPLLTRKAARSAVGGLKFYTAYKRAKFSLRKGRYTQLQESTYTL
ncbi:NAD(P)/FAD-dependent oxidoreductase [Halobacteriaceae archaeon GCM10025711]